MNYLYESIKPTRLYIKQCPHCELKYFGKSNSQNIVSYRGSGTRWRRHLNKHKVEPIHLWNSDWYYDTSIKRFALKFSRINKIVKSDEWANLKEEDGLDGGWYLINKMRKTGEIKVNSSWENVNKMRKMGIIPPSINTKEISDKRNKTLYDKDPNFYKNVGTIGNQSFIKSMENESYKEEYLQKHKESLPKDHQRGTKNSQFGKKFKFVNNGKVNKKIEVSELEDYLKSGYFIGRIRDTV